MVIVDTPIQGLKVIEFKLVRDERGHFARSFCAEDFRRHDLIAPIAQANLSFCHRKGTIRGLHYQGPPVSEVKLMRCTRGAIADMVVDLRPESPTFLHHFVIELNADSYKALYVPGRFANGYQALTDNAEAAYQVSEFYKPGAEQGVRYDDPSLRLPWPTKPTVISTKDRNLPLLSDERIAAVRRELSI
jgi:dTDP-4-dehydrorhamnose 3,5-epimerase